MSRNSRPLLGRCDRCRVKVWQRSDGSEVVRQAGKDADHHHRHGYTIWPDDEPPATDRDWHHVAPGFNPAWS